MDYHDRPCRWTWMLIYVWDIVHYPMTSVKFSGEIRCWNLDDYATPSDTHLQESKNESKNPCPYPLRNCIIPNLATVKPPGTTRSPSWELCNRMGSFYRGTEHSAALITSVFPLAWHLFTARHHDSCPTI